MRPSLIGPAIIALVTGAFAQPGSEPRAILNQAIAEFENGRFAESVAAFDSLIKVAPQVAPELWQRGIALYYAGRYDGCRAQFEAHRTVNPDDVENAAWHFLCVARADGPEKARAALLPVGPDPRVPMRQVYQMFQGSLSSERVIAAAGAELSPQFYAHLYVGLYADALGKEDIAREHIKAAAAQRYAAVGGYMHMVARVHLSVLQQRR